MDDHTTVMQNGKCRRGFVAKFNDGHYAYTGDYFPVLIDQYSAFRDAMIKEPFE